MTLPFDTLLPCPTVTDRYLTQDYYSCSPFSSIHPTYSTFNHPNQLFNIDNQHFEQTIDQRQTYTYHQHPQQQFQQRSLPLPVGSYSSSPVALSNLSQEQQLNLRPHPPTHTSFGSSSLPLRSKVGGPSVTTDYNNYLPLQHQSMYATQNMMSAAVTPQGSLKRSRSHQRTPSASTIASNGPNSPYTSVAPYTHIANTDHSPLSPSQYPEQTFAKALPIPSQTPIEANFVSSNLTQMPNAHLAMSNFALQHHAETDYPSDMAPSRQSTSSHGLDSPATPQDGVDDFDLRSYNTLQYGENLTSELLDMFGDLPFTYSDVKQSNPALSLFRSDSTQAIQDELYSPHLVYATPVATSSKSQNQAYLSPHRNLINQRLETANLYRSTSPNTSLSRERSPFRDGSILAPSRNWGAGLQAGGSAAELRRRQKEQADKEEFVTRPSLPRERTQTISPKDALLDYHDSSEQAPLFPQDNLPAGYESHRGGAEQWTTNAPTFALAPSSQQSIATSADPAYAATSFNLPALPQSSGEQVQATSYPGTYSSAAVTKTENFDSPPHFPAPLPSMETSNSDAGMPFSSQEEVPTTKIQRPTDTRANTGTYTCTYHGCTQRFESQPSLQRHKRDAHRAQPQQQHHQASPSSEGSTSPRDTESPAPVGSGMTSAAILARNSQAGPHKCERINPSTGKPCNTVFSRPYDLTRHEDTIHNNRKHKVRCQYCREEKTFSRTDALTRHMRVVHPDIEASTKRGRRGD